MDVGKESDHLDDMNHVENHCKISTEEIKSRGSRYEQIVIITDHHYLPFLYHLKTSKVLIYADELLTIRDIKDCFLKRREYSTKKTLYILVLGIYSLAKMSSYKDCVNCETPLQGLNPWEEVKNIPNFVENYLNELRSIMNILESSIPCESSVTVLPPVPLALIATNIDHDLLHYNKSRFPNYFIINKCGNLVPLYSFWSRRVTSFSCSSLKCSTAVPQSIFSEFVTNHKTIEVMKCLVEDRPSYNLWKEFLNFITHCEVNETTATFNILKPCHSHCEDLVDGAILGDDVNIFSDVLQIEHNSNFACTGNLTKTDANERICITIQGNNCAIPDMPNAEQASVNQTDNIVVDLTTIKTERNYDSLLDDYSNNFDFNPQMFLTSGNKVARPVDLKLEVSVHDSLNIKGEEFDEEGTSDLDDLNCYNLPVSLQSEKLKKENNKFHENNNKYDIVKQELDPLYDAHKSTDIQHLFKMDTLNFSSCQAESNFEEVCYVSSMIPSLDEMFQTNESQLTTQQPSDKNVIAISVENEVDYDSETINNVYFKDFQMMTGKDLKAEQKLNKFNCSLSKDSLKDFKGSLNSENILRNFEGPFDAKVRLKDSPCTIPFIFDNKKQGLLNADKIVKDPFREDKRDYFNLNNSLNTINESATNSLNMEKCATFSLNVDNIVKDFFATNKTSLDSLTPDETFKEILEPFCNTSQVEIKKSIENLLNDPLKISLKTQSLSQESEVGYGQNDLGIPTAATFDAVLNLPLPPALMSLNLSAFDHLIFIGHRTSLELIPDFSFCRHSKWNFDSVLEVENLKKNLSALNKQRNKFIFLSDISMISFQDIYPQCSLNNCTHPLKYVIFPHSEHFVMKSIKKFTDNMQKIIAYIKSMSGHQSNICIAPFTPMIYSLALSIIINKDISHSAVHDYHCINTCLLGGSCIKEWGKIFEKFQYTWNNLPLSIDLTVYDKNIINLNYSPIIFKDISLSSGPIDLKDRNLLQWQNSLEAIVKEACFDFPVPLLEKTTGPNSLNSKKRIKHSGKLCLKIANSKNISAVSSRKNLSARKLTKVNKTFASFPPLEEQTVIVCNSPNLVEVNKLKGAIVKSHFPKPTQFRWLRELDLVNDTSLNSSKVIMINESSESLNKSAIESVVEMESSISEHLSAIRSQVTESQADMVKVKASNFSQHPRTIISHSQPTYSTVEKESSRSISKPVAKVCPQPIKLIVTDKTPLKTKQATTPCKIADSRKFFLVGSKKVVRAVNRCKIKFDRVINHSCDSFKESDIEYMLKEIGATSGKSICCLAFDLSIILKKLQKSILCCEGSCSQHLDIYALQTNSLISYQSLETVDDCIQSLLQIISKFVHDLSQHIPVIVLPLVPARLYCEVGNSQDHNICHTLSDLGFYIVNGTSTLWKHAVQSLCHLWNELMKSNNEKFTSLSSFSKCHSKNQNSFLMLDDFHDFVAHWTAPNTWKSFIEAYLLSITSSKVIKNDVASSKQPASCLKIIEPSVTICQNSKVFGKDLRNKLNGGKSKMKHSRESSKKGDESLPFVFNSVSEVSLENCASHDGGIYNGELMYTDQIGLNHKRTNSSIIGSKGLKSRNRSVISRLRSRSIDSYSRSSMHKKASKRSRSKENNANPKRSLKTHNSSSETGLKSSMHRRSRVISKKKNRSNTDSHHNQSKTLSSPSNEGHNYSSKERNLMDVNSYGLNDNDLHGSEKKIYHDINKEISPSCSSVSSSEMVKNLVGEYETSATSKPDERTQEEATVYENILKSIELDLENEYANYGNNLEVHPFYKENYEVFFQSYIEQFGSEGGQPRLDMLWNIFWSNKLDDYKNQDWVSRKHSLDKKFKNIFQKYSSTLIK